MWLQRDERDLRDEPDLRDLRDEPDWRDLRDEPDSRDEHVTIIFLFGSS